MKDAFSMGRFPIQNMFSILEPDLLDSIGQFPSHEEVHNALFDVKHRGDSLVCMVKRVFERVPYKVLTKVIVNRLKPIMSSLITANQTSFVRGRNIMDNVIIAQEVVHLKQHQKRKKGWMAIKIDMENAYHRLR
ncbi:Retrovirus-related Pol polyprotein LINE-1 [Gossypium australe]|uniref:Retrovirus-related Pol polyprotein LINE-1 n=1 Tax=Gossypium australe TaxID=47621 RepID=A0A5B6UYE7_9ROSI|nr:Retrovirus-related Pol polyprotein LINE-1 [Gossypium australe]